MHMQAQEQGKTQIPFRNNKQSGCWLAGADPEEAVRFYAAGLVAPMVPEKVWFA